MRSRRMVSIVLILTLVCSGFLVFSTWNSEDRLEGSVRSRENEPRWENVETRFAGGDGSEGNPYQISNVTQLQDMSLNLSAHFVLINDIVANVTNGWYEGAGFEPIGRHEWGGAPFHGTPFTGKLNGRGYKISGLFIDRRTNYFQGLFGKLYTGALICNVSLREVDINSKDYVGGFAGEIYGATMENCSVTGIIKGHNGCMKGGGTCWKNGPWHHEILFFVRNCKTFCTRG